MKHFVDTVCKPLSTNVIISVEKFYEAKNKRREILQAKEEEKKAQDEADRKMKEEQQHGTESGSQSG